MRKTLLALFLIALFFVAGFTGFYFGFKAQDENYYHSSLNVGLSHFNDDIDILEILRKNEDNYYPLIEAIEFRAIFYLSLMKTSKTNFQQLKDESLVCLAKLIDYKDSLGFLSLTIHEDLSKITDDYLESLSPVIKEEIEGRSIQQDQKAQKLKQKLFNQIKNSNKNFKRTLGAEVLPE